MEHPWLTHFFLCRRSMNENEFAPLGIDLYPVAFFEFPSENLNRQRVLNQSLDGAFERAGAVNRVDSPCRRSTPWRAR